MNHGDGLEKFGPATRDALKEFVDYAAVNYGWKPAGPVCVHVYKNPDDFVEALQVRAGMDVATAESYRRFSGTVGREMQSGADAAYINAGIINVPELVARTAVHEYVHIVQGHLGGTMGGLQSSFPTWFLEGMAYWEPDKVLGVRYPNWLILLREDVQRGRDLPLSALTWEFYTAARKTPTSPNPLSAGGKMRAAFMFLEKIAGPTAAAQILRGNHGGSLTTFAVVFQQVSGFTPEEFEVRLREFITEGQ